MKSLIGTGLTASMFLSAFMCVGMGMSMPDAPGVDVGTASGHECCDSDVPKESQDEQSAATCCLFLPGISASSVSLPDRADNLLLAVLTADSLRSQISEIGDLIDTRAPPNVEEFVFAVPASRAPPTV